MANKSTFLEPVLFTKDADILFKMTLMLMENYACDKDLPTMVVDNVSNTLGLFLIYN